MFDHIKSSSSFVVLRRNGGIEADTNLRQVVYMFNLFSSLCFTQAPPKQVPHTIESLRIPDETMVDPEDEEVCVTLLIILK